MVTYAACLIISFPKSRRRQTLGANPDVKSILDLVGNAKRGELIFLSDNNRCRNCHDVSDSQKSLGPTLSEMRLRKMKPSDLLQQIVRPSSRVEEKYATWVVVTTDGYSRIRIA